MDTPILFIIFNRPDTTKAVIDALRLAKPAKLYIAADGPRTNKPGEESLCKDTRKIIETIDWPCEITRKYSDQNLGCKRAVSEAITWFFNNVEEGIILEDDCVPYPSFFRYAAELLKKYADNEQIMHINGTTFLTDKDLADPEDSYHFSSIDHVWGWATWRRAWQKYDIDMKHIDALKGRVDQFWIDLFHHVKNKKIDTWDAQWLYSIFTENGLAITPNSNLISNIGFDSRATHTKTTGAIIPPIESMDFPLIHPALIKQDVKADQILLKRVFVRSLWKRILDSLFK